MKSNITSLIFIGTILVGCASHQPVVTPTAHVNAPAPSYPSRDDPRYQAQCAWGEQLMKQSGGTMHEIGVDSEGHVIEASKKTYPIPAAAESPETPIKTIYDSLALGDIKLDNAIVSSTGKLDVQQVLMNTSRSTLIIPIDKTHSRPMHLAGTIQYWIERLGADATIPSFSERIARDDRKYAYGGSVIISPDTIEVGGSIELPKTIDATKLVPGRYELTVQYKEIDSNKIISSKTIQFTVSDK